MMIFEGLVTERQLIGGLKSSGIEKYSSGRGLHRLIAHVQMDTDADHRGRGQFESLFTQWGREGGVRPLGTKRKKRIKERKI